MIKVPTYRRLSVWCRCLTLERAKDMYVQVSKTVCVVCVWVAQHEYLLHL